MFSFFSSEGVVLVSLLILTAGGALHPDTKREKLVKKLVAV